MPQKSHIPCILRLSHIYFFRALEDLTLQELANGRSWAKSGRQPVFINKVLLARGHIHSFTLLSVAASALEQQS